MKELKATDWLENTLIQVENICVFLVIDEIKKILSSEKITKNVMKSRNFEKVRLSTNKCYVSLKSLFE